MEELDIGLTGTLVVFAVTLSLFLALVKKARERNYPPGPTGLPVIGYAPFLGKNPHKALSKLGKKYGDFFSFTIGPQLYICVTDYHLAKDLLSHPYALARPTKSFEFLMGHGGFAGVNGEEWIEQRRFAFFTMRNLGMGKGIWESLIQMSCEDFVSEIKGWKGRPMCIEDPLSFSTSNNNVTLLIGRRFDKEKDAEKLKLIRECSRPMMELFSSVGLAMSLPWLSNIMLALRIGAFRKLLPLLRSFENIFRSEVEERMRDPSSLLKEDYIGCYFQEMERKEKEGKPHFFSKDNLLGSLLILFMGGNDSTMAGTQWLLLLMAKHQDIQKRIHDEIDSVIGRDGNVYYDQKYQLRYTMATLYEMLRYASISAVFPPRTAVQTFQFNGYTIPKGCHITVNMWSISRDPRYFDDPLDFKPERFLSETQDKIQKLDGWAPFSFGKRNCPGEGVAIMTIFMYFVHIMQKFRVSMPPGVEPDLEPSFAAGLIPRPQQMVFTER